MLADRPPGERVRFQVYDVVAGLDVTATAAAALLGPLGDDARRLGLCCGPRHLGVARRYLRLDLSGNEEGGISGGGVVALMSAGLCPDRTVAHGGATAVGNDVPVLATALRGGLEAADRRGGSTVGDGAFGAGRRELGGPGVQGCDVVLEGTLGGAGR